MSEDAPNNVILATEAGVVVMTDLSSELQMPSDGLVDCFDPVVGVHPVHQVPQEAAFFWIQNS